MYIVYIHILFKKKSNFINDLGTRSKRTQQSKIPWYRKPIMKSAIYTDLQRGAWHIGLFTMVRIR